MLKFTNRDGKEQFEREKYTEGLAKIENYIDYLESMKERIEAGDLRYRDGSFHASSPAEFDDVFEDHMTYTHGNYIIISMQIIIKRGDK